MKLWLRCLAIACPRRDRVNVTGINAAHEFPNSATIQDSTMPRHEHERKPALSAFVPNPCFSDGVSLVGCIQSTRGERRFCGHSCDDGSFPSASSHNQR